MRIGILSVIILLLTVSVHAQYFIENTSAGDFTNSPLHQAGGAWVDLNNDRYPDLVVMGYDHSSRSRNRIYINNRDKTFKALQDHEFYKSKLGGPLCIAGDYDNDGDKDIYQVNYQDNDENASHNYLFTNSGAPNYALSQSDLLNPQNSIASFSSTASWVDYDQDGDLDLYTTGSSSTPATFHEYDETSFERKNQLAFLSAPASSITSDTWFDYDSDGDLDLYLTNFNQNNKLYISLFAESGNPESFAELSIPNLTNRDGSNIGCNWVDIDNDLDYDLFLNFFNTTDKLYINQGDDTYTQANSPVSTHAGWTTINAWVDYDNDGDLDLYLNTLENNLYQGILYDNDGSGSFTRISENVGGDICTHVFSPQAGGWSDYDNDGDMDLAIITCCAFFPDGQALNNKLFENQIGDKNNHSKIYLEGRSANRSAIGAEVRIKATINDQPVWQLRRVSGGVESFGMHEDHFIHFGLGDADVIDTMIIRWSINSIDTCTSVPIGNISIIENSCQPMILSNHKVPSSTRFFSVDPNPASYYLSLQNLGEETIIQVTINSMNGHIIQQNSVQLHKNDTTRISVQDVPAGIYIIGVSYENDITRFQKIILN